MNTQRLFVGLVIMMTCQAFAAPPRLNTLPEGDPGTMAKVNRYVAGVNTSDPNVLQKGKVGCNQNVGNVTVGKDGKTPNEVLTVIRGDVVNVCK